MTRIYLITGTYITIKEYADSLTINENGFYTVTIQANGVETSVFLLKNDCVWIENTVTPAP